MFATAIAIQGTRLFHYADYIVNKTDSITDSESRGLFEFGQEFTQ